MGPNDRDDDVRLAEARSQLADCDGLIEETRRQRDRLVQLGRDPAHLEGRLAMLERVRAERERYVRSIAAKPAPAAARRDHGGAAAERLQPFDLLVEEQLRLRPSATAAELAATLLMTEPGHDEVQAVTDKQKQFVRDSIGRLIRFGLTTRKPSRE